MPVDSIQLRKGNPPTHRIRNSIKIAALLFAFVTVGSISLLFRESTRKGSLQALPEETPVSSGARDSVEQDSGSSDAAVYYKRILGSGGRPINWAKRNELIGLDGIKAINNPCDNPGVREIVRQDGSIEYARLPDPNLTERENSFHLQMAYLGSRYFVDAEGEMTAVLLPDDRQYALDSTNLYGVADQPTEYILQRPNGSKVRLRQQEIVYDDSMSLVSPVSTFYVAGGEDRRYELRKDSEGTRLIDPNGDLIGSQAEGVAFPVTNDPEFCYGDLDSEISPLRWLTVDPSLEQEAAFLGMMEARASETSE